MKKLLSVLLALCLVLSIMPMTIALAAEVPAVVSKVPAPASTLFNDACDNFSGFHNDGGLAPGFATDENGNSVLKMERTTDDFRFWKWVDSLQGNYDNGGKITYQFDVYVPNQAVGEQPSGFKVFVRGYNDGTKFNLFSFKPKWDNSSQLMIYESERGKPEHFFSTDTWYTFAVTFTNTGGNSYNYNVYVDGEAIYENRSVSLPSDKMHTFGFWTDNWWCCGSNPSNELAYVDNFCAYTGDAQTKPAATEAPATEAPEETEAPAITKLSGTTFGTEPYQSGRPGYDKVFDGDIATYFSGAQGGYCGYDFGEGKEATVSYVKAYPRDSYPGRLNGQLIQGSNDNTNWDTLYTISGCDTAKWYQFDINATKGYRYIRYYSPTESCNIAEFDVYGVIGDAEAPAEPTEAPTPTPDPFAAYAGKYPVADRNKPTDLWLHPNRNISDVAAGKKIGPGDGELYIWSDTIKGAYSGKEIMIPFTATADGNSALGYMNRSSQRTKIYDFEEGTADYVLALVPGVKYILLKDNVQVATGDWIAEGDWWNIVFFVHDSASNNLTIGFDNTKAYDVMEWVGDVEPTEEPTEEPAPVVGHDGDAIKSLDPERPNAFFYQFNISGLTDAVALDGVEITYTLKDTGKDPFTKFFSLAGVSGVDLKLASVIADIPASYTSNTIISDFVLKYIVGGADKTIEWSKSAALSDLN